MSTSWNSPDPAERSEDMPAPEAASTLAAPTPEEDDHRASPLTRLVLIVAGVVAGIALVFSAFALAVVLGGGDDEPERAATDTSAPGPVPTGEVAPTTPAPGTTVAGLAPADLTVAPTAAPAGDSTAAPTAAPASTAATSAPLPSTGVPDGEAEAYRVAQALADALADGRWDDARALIGNRVKPTDEQLSAAYEALVRAAVVPSRSTPLGGERYDLRFGIVAHEEGPAGPQTSLICSHWDVDTATRTVLRIDFARLRVEPGWVAPADHSGELTTTCATLPLD